MNIVKLSMISGILLGGESLTAMEPTPSPVPVFEHSYGPLTHAELESLYRSLKYYDLVEKIKKTPAGTIAQHFQEIAQFRAIDTTSPQPPTIHPRLEKMSPLIRARIAELENNQISQRKARQEEERSFLELVVAPDRKTQKLRASRSGGTVRDGNFFRFSYRSSAPNLSRENRAVYNEKEKKRIHSNLVNTELTWHAEEYTGQQNYLSHSAHKRRMLLEAQSEVAEARSTLPGTTPE